MVAKNQDKLSIKEDTKILDKAKVNEKFTTNQKELISINLKDTNQELFKNTEDNKIQSKNLDNTLNIKNCLNKYPPKMNHHYNQTFKFENKNTFTQVNDTLGNINNEKTPSIFLNHLLFKGFPNNNTENYVTLSFVQRKKSKNIILTYYSPVLIKN